MALNPTKLDEIDEQIIALLQADGRRSYGELGKAVGLSEAAARQRVNRLREIGVMRIVAIVDPIQLGRGVVATLGVRVSGDTRLVAARLAEVPEIEYVVLTAGSFDLIAELVCETEEELLRVINEEVRAIEHVRETETFMHLRTEKNVFASVGRSPAQRARGPARAPGSARRTRSRPAPNSSNKRA